MSQFLSKSLVEKLDFQLALSRILKDIDSDFFIAPHLKHIYLNASDSLIENTKQLLVSDSYQPRLPISMEVVKGNGFTRKGSTLLPYDRLIYQVLVDSIAPIADKEIDHSRVFSYPLNNNSSEYMFASSSDSYEKMFSLLKTISSENDYNYILKADISSYYDHIYQHFVINQINSCGVEQEIVNSLEKFLSALSSKKSPGIPQGLLPSDFLANLYLCSIDAYHDDYHFARYVDDIYIFFKDKRLARLHTSKLCEWLRKLNLTLNEAKTKVIPLRKFLDQEEYLDNFFKEARSDIEDEFGPKPIVSHYGEIIDWTDPTPVPEEIIKQHKISSLHKLFDELKKKDKHILYKDKIIRFCISNFIGMGDDYGIDFVKQEFSYYPSLAPLFSRYVFQMIKLKKMTLKEFFEAAVLPNENYLFPYQEAWLLSAILYSDEPYQPAVKFAQKRISSPVVPLSALAIISCSRHGGAAARQVVRDAIEETNSEYLKVAQLYSTQFFPVGEGKVLRRILSANPEPTIKLFLSTY